MEYLAGAFLFLVFVLSPIVLGVWLVWDGTKNWIVRAMAVPIVSMGWVLVLALGLGSINRQAVTATARECARSFVGC